MMTPPSNFDHLTINPIPKKEILYSDWNVNNGIQLYFKKKILSSPLTQHLIRRIIGKFDHYLRIAEIKKREKMTIDNLHKDIPDSHKSSSSFGYLEESFELRTAIKYMKQLEGNIKELPTESYELYQHIFSEMKMLFEGDKTIASFLNFGVSHAYIDSVMAKENPNISFIGTDRSTLTKAHNEKYFSGINNMTFVSDDIFSLLNERQFENSVFFHARTLTLLSKSFIERLYRSAAASGFKYIVGLEQIGISRETFKPYIFSEEDQQSTFFRHHMYVHNYPFLLKQAGYQLQKVHLLKTKHPHKDLRFLCFTSIRKSS